MTALTQQRLHAVLVYDPATGEFQWRSARGGTAKPGVTAGSTTDEEYRVISVDCRRYKAHRLAWLYVHGYLPPQQIDHINGDRGDNRLSNLRLATQAENRRNLSTYKNNKSGFRGVYFHKVMGKWRAQIKANGEIAILGFFAAAEEAAAAYDRAAIEKHGAFARPNSAPYKKTKPKGLASDHPHLDRV